MNGYDMLIFFSLGFAVLGLVLDKFLDVYVALKKEIRKMDKKINRKEVIK